LFGVPLQLALERNSREPFQQVPTIAEEIIDYIKHQGLKQANIFNTTGDANKIQYLRRLYNKDGTVKLNVECNGDVHSAVGLLQAFIKELPDTLLTSRYYDTFLKIQENPDNIARLRNTAALMVRLPPCNQSILRALLQLLVAVVCEPSNGMSSQKLGAVLAPIFFQGDNSQDAVNLLSFLIDNSAYLMNSHLVAPEKNLGLSEKKLKISSPSPYKLTKKVMPTVEEVLQHLLHSSVSFLFDPSVIVSREYEAIIEKQHMVRWETKNMLEVISRNSIVKRNAHFRSKTISCDNFEGISNGLDPKKSLHNELLCSYNTKKEETISNSKSTVNPTGHIRLTPEKAIEKKQMGPVLPELKEKIYGKRK